MPGDSSDPILSTLWLYDGAGPDVEIGEVALQDGAHYPDNTSGYTAVWFWAIFEESIKAAGKAIGDGNFPRVRASPPPVLHCFAACIPRASFPACHRPSASAWP